MWFTYYFSKIPGCSSIFSIRIVKFVKCTYDDLNLFEIEFLKNWLREEIPIKIIFP